MQKHMNGLMRFDYQLLNIKLAITDTFGQSIANIVVYHSVVLFLKVYVGIAMLRKSRDQLDFYMVAQLIWITPYLARIVLLVFVFTPIYTQVPLHPHRIHLVLQRFK